MVGRHKEGKGVCYYRAYTPMPYRLTTKPFFLLLPYNLPAEGRSKEAHESKVVRVYSARLNYNYIKYKYVKIIINNTNLRVFTLNYD